MKSPASSLHPPATRHTVSPPVAAPSTSATTSSAPSAVFTPNVEIGGGDSSSLVNPTVTKNYTSLGPLAHFQVGVSIDLVRGAIFETDAYEQLPIGDQKIYGPLRNGKATVVVGHGVTEDNGFTNALDIPFGGHFTLSGYYSRSLRIHSDTAAIGFTYVIRAAPATEQGPVDDLFP